MYGGVCNAPKTKHDYCVTFHLSASHTILEYWRAPAMTGAFHRVQMCTENYETNCQHTPAHINGVVFAFGCEMTPLQLS